MFNLKIVTKLWIISIFAFGSLFSQKSPFSPPIHKNKINSAPGNEMGVSEVIEFNDLKLEKAVRDALNKPTGNIFGSDMAKLTTFSAESKGIVDLTGLEYAINLEALYLSKNQIQDISALSNLHELYVLYLSNNQVHDIPFFENFPRLEWLLLNINYIHDISGLANLTSLKTLHLGGNHLSNDDLIHLYGMDNLKKSYPGGNFLSLISNPGVTSGIAVQELANNLDKMSCSQIDWDGTCGVDPNLAAISRLTPEIAQRRQNVTVEATATNSAGEDVQMQIDWGDGTVSDWTNFQPNASSFEFSHDYSTVGTYSIKVISCNQSNEKTAWSAPKNVAIQDGNQAPKVRFVEVKPKAVRVGQAVYVYFIIQDPDGPGVRVKKIDWGDGGIVQYNSNFINDTFVQSRCSHQYSSSGKYSIRIIAEDEKGLEGPWFEPEIAIVDSPPEARILSVTPNSAGIGQTIIVEATGTDPEFDRIMLKID